jgi:hypothetical protein
MGIRFLVTIAIALSVGAVAAAEMPCVSVERELRALGPGGADVPPAFLECARKSRVCVLTFPDSQVLRAESLRELPADGASSLAIVQSPPGEQPALCLVGTYSGGSAAAWSFEGWNVSAGAAAPIRGMERARLNNDSVPPRTLGNAIYGAYARAQK